MRYQYFRGRAFAFLALVTVIASVLLVGCPGAKTGSLEQIAIVKYRYVIDESDDIVRVVGLARNIGELPTPEAEIIATLRSRTGSFKGQNRTALRELDPGAEEQFALAVNSHGAVESVEIEVVEPGTITEEGAEQAPEDDIEEANGDGS